MKRKRNPCSAATLAIVGAAFCSMGFTATSGAESDSRESHEKSAVYLISNPGGANSVLAFSRDRATGKLTPKGLYLTGGMGDPSVGGFESHSLVNDDRHLYAVNPGDDTISSFAIHEDGSLRLLNVVPSGGRRPVAVAVHDDLLYVANEGNTPGLPADQQLPGSYSGFRVRHDGSLAPVPGSTILLNKGDSPAEILFNHDGTRLIANRLGGNVIDTFHVTRDGRLDRAAPLENQPGPFGAIFSPVHPNQFFVGLASPDAGQPAPGVAAYHLPHIGAPALINAVTDAPQQDPCWSVITRDGRHLWYSAFIPITLTLYSIAQDGHVSEVSANTPHDDDVGSTDVALDSSERHLYRLRAFPVAGADPRVPRLEVFSTTGKKTDGGLALSQSLSLTADVFSLDLTQAGIMGLVVVDL